MSTLTALYNALPPVEIADALFKDRDTMLSKLTPLLAKYDNQFGVCLVHAHCTIEDGEKMVAQGNVSEPMRDIPCYPERWLATGEPYEFNHELTKTPPAELFDAFRALIGDITVLGLFYAGGLADGILLERTEGRKNITELIKSTDLGIGQDIETAWLPSQDGSGNPVKAKCMIMCMLDGSKHTGQAHYDHVEAKPIGI
ncbi:hypothetical protein OBBRIDRAFT_833592 [Obba rivulosa]|uniref:Uncharacterized protein n=1 Tax=Obba rivulosa TaxID=1052685 RepID=A0A8E2B029_9APHY|nr:hypothetical protein OBBRIDRAFT_833592 [Obba rivulosa]